MNRKQKESLAILSLYIATSVVIGLHNPPIPIGILCGTICAMPWMLHDMLRKV